MLWSLPRLENGCFSWMLPHHSMQKCSFHQCHPFKKAACLCLRLFSNCTPWRVFFFGVTSSSSSVGFQVPAFLTTSLIWSSVALLAVKHTPQFHPPFSKTTKFPPLKLGPKPNKESRLGQTVEAFGAFPSTKAFVTAWVDCTGHQAPLPLDPRKFPPKPSASGRRERCIADWQK